MKLLPTVRLYLQDDHRFENEAIVLGISENGLAFDQTCFHPGGGGQPSDKGLIQFADDSIVEVISIQSEDGVLWHICDEPPKPEWVGGKVVLKVHQARRAALMRYHTVLHVLNTIALRNYNGWITGVQINEDYSRIDFKLENFTPALAAELEAKVNAVIEADHPLRSYYLTEAEFHTGTDLLRTLEAQPPILDGQVRVVEIVGFDAQACGGTHVHSTREAGRFIIYKTDNKGKNNKRFYVRLAEA